MKEYNIMILDSEDLVLDIIKAAINEIDDSSIKSMKLVLFKKPENVINVITKSVNNGNEIFIFIISHPDNLAGDVDEVYLALVREIKWRFPRIMTVLLTDIKTTDSKHGLFNDASKIIEQEILDAWVEKKSKDFKESLKKLVIEFVLDYNALYLGKRKSLLGSEILITGATGFIGKILIHELLKRTDCNLYKLGRARKGKSISERLGVKSDRIRYFQIDLLDLTHDLVKSTPEYLSLIDTNDEIWHLTAITNLANDNRTEILENNVIGVLNLLNFGKQFKKLKCFNHISTSYVSGNIYYPAKILEDEIPSPRRFKNPYEESKCYIECILKNSGLPFRIFRPSMVVGNSKTGACDIKTRKNIIPMNTVVDIMLRIRNSNRGLNKTFSLSNPISISVDDILGTIANIQGIKLKYR
ncbi:MAG: SDR family oxidoreductase, partial [Promethearchaeota archaeon]